MEVLLPSQHSIGDVHALSLGRIADGLELGFGWHHPFLQYLESSMRLRVPGGCGMASVAVRMYAGSLSIPSELVVSRPGLAFDPDMEHVLVVAESTAGNVLIDPTYSQLLQYVGLTPGYVLHGGHNLFPRQKVALFDEMQRLGFAKQLAAHAAVFNRVRRPYQVPRGALLGVGPLNDASEAQITEYFAEVWNPDHFSPFEPTNDLRSRGIAVSTYI